MVSLTTFAAIAASGIIAVIVPVILTIIIKLKYNSKLSACLIGCAVWFVMVMVLENIMHVIVLKSALGETIQANIWLYALYGGLAAGIFEETGRLFAMKVLLKKQHDDRHTALMYGIGHGGMESILVVGISSVNNIIYSAMINAGQTNMLLSQVPEEAHEQLQNAFDQLIESPSGLFLLSGWERITAIFLHLALSSLVWIAVVKHKPVMFPLAVFLHAGFDALCVLIKDQVNYVVLELMLSAVTILIVFLARLIWKRIFHAQDKPQTPADASA